MVTPTCTNPVHDVVCLFFFSKHCSNIMWKSGVHYHIELQILFIWRIKNQLKMCWSTPKMTAKAFQKNKYLYSTKSGLVTWTQLTCFLLSLSPQPGQACRCSRTGPSCLCSISLRIGTVISAWHFPSWLIPNTQTRFSRANSGHIISINCEDKTEPSL